MVQSFKVYTLCVVLQLEFAFYFSDKDPCASLQFFFLKGWKESEAMFNTEMEKLPLVSNPAEHAEEEYRVERSGAREEEERERMREGIRGKVDERVRSGGEMRPGEGKVGEKCCRSGLRQRRLRICRQGRRVVIIRPVTRHNGKEPAICQLRPAPKMSPASVTSHLDRWLVVE